MITNKNCTLTNAEAPTNFPSGQYSEEKELGSYPALVINDCVFHKIYHFDDSKAYGPIKDSCLFYDCQSTQAIILLSVREATITHLCIYNCRSKNQEEFIKIDIDPSSFCKILFSTFVGRGNDSNVNSENNPRGSEFQSGHYQL